MKTSNAVLFCFLTLILGCTKTSDGIEKVGTFQDATSGFEGTITYADGRPAIGCPVRMAVGATGNSVTVDLTTGAISPINAPNTYQKDTVTNKNGQYRFVEVNKNLPFKYGYFAVSAWINPKLIFNYFEKEYTVDGKLQDNTIQVNTEFAFGKIKKIDVKLYEAVLLHLDSRGISIDYDHVEFSGKWFSAITGKATDFSQGYDAPPLTRSSSIIFTSKPNVPINLTAQFSKNKTIVATRTLTIPMNLLDNYIEIK
jgi:hypothetical protein